MRYIPASFMQVRQLSPHPAWPSPRHPTSVTPLCKTTAPCYSCRCKVLQLKSPLRSSGTHANAMAAVAGCLVTTCILLLNLSCTLQIKRSLLCAYTAPARPSLLSYSCCCWLLAVKNTPPVLPACSACARVGALLLLRGGLLLLWLLLLLLWGSCLACLR